MIDQATAPTPVKLRSSCDACGAAKLKCDRSQPRCGRCVSLDVTCVYGVSRQMGKPRKCSRQPQIPDTLSRRPESCAPSHYDDSSSGLVPGDISRSDDGGISNNQASPGAIGTHHLAHPSPHHHPTGLSHSWLASAADVTMDSHAVSGYHNSSHAMDGGIWTDLIGSSPATDLADYANEALHSEHESVWGLQAAMPTSDNNLYPTAATQADDGIRPLANGPEYQELMRRPRQQHPHLAHLDANALAASNGGSGRACSSRAGSISGSVNGHDCFQDTYDILGSLFLSGTGAASIPPGSIPQSPMGSTSKLSIGTSSGTTSTTVTSPSSSMSNGSRVSLDEILHRSRQACARLSRVFTCPVCPRSANLALLHVSIISRILVWYQHAVECMSSPTQLHTLASAMPPESTAGGAAAAAHNQHHSHHAPLHMALPPVGIPFDLQGGGPSGSPWPCTPTTSGSLKTTPNNTSSPSSSAPGVTPMKIVMGTFDVKDQRVQMALNMQLLLGEVRGLAELIDQFCTYGAGSGAGVAAGVVGGGGDNDLYHTLDTWLKAQHGRIVDMIRMHLRKLNG